jgi:hypothetical protein
MIVLKLLGEDQGLIAEREYQLVEDRCWTPTTVIGERLYVRCDDKLICFLVSGEPSNGDLANMVDEPKEFKLERGDVVAVFDPVGAIFTAFQSKGQTAALELYASFRSDGKLSAEQRVALVEAAKDDGLAQLARMILGHAAEDLPDSLLIQNAVKRFDN